MKLKIIGLFLLTLLLNVTQAQESVKLKVGFKPNKIYHLKIEVISDNYMNYEGDSSLIDQIKQAGVKIPMKVVTTVNMEETIETGDLRDDNSMKVFMKVEKVDTKSQLNGAENIDTSKNIFKNLELEGIYHPDNKISGIIIKGSNVPENLKNIVMQMLGEIFDKFKFPEKPVKIGESFDQEVPVQIPMANMGAMNIKTINNFLLEKIENGDSYFKVKSHLEITTTDPNLTSDTKGEGDGIFIYNIKDEFYHTYNTDMDVSMKMAANGLTIVSKSKSKTKMECKID